MAVRRDVNFVCHTPVRIVVNAPKAGAAIFVSVIKGGVVKIVARGSSQPKDLEETALRYIMQASIPSNCHGITVCPSAPANQTAC